MQNLDGFFVVKLNNLWKNNHGAGEMRNLNAHVTERHRLIWTHHQPRKCLWGRETPDDILKWIFMNENVGASIKISLKSVPIGTINNIPALVQIMDWRLPGDKLLSEPMMVKLLTHICVTRPQWVNISFARQLMIFLQENKIFASITYCSGTQEWYAFGLIMIQRRHAPLNLASLYKLMFNVTTPYF